MEEDLLVVIALLTHDGSAYLAETDAMPPAFALETETSGGLLDIEGGAIEMGFAQGSANLEFLADGEGLLGSHNLELPDATTLASLQGDEVGNGTEIGIELGVDERGKFVGGVIDRPAIEVVGFLVVVVQHLRQHLFVVGVAEGVVHADEVRLGRIFPAILELLGHTTTALGEAGVANLIAIAENLTACGLERLLDSLAGLLGDALIALAMVVGTNIKDGMVFAVVPANELVVFLDKREEAVLLFLILLTATHLRQQPRTGDDGMSLEQLDASGSFHLAADNAGQILFDGQFVDSRNLIGLNHQLERAQEHLRLLALPMEIDTDGDIIE